MATTIEYTVQAGDILGVGDAAGYDAEASARAYAALLETELAAAYPDATISVRVARTSGGREIAAYVTDADGLPGDDAPVRERVREIAGRLYERRAGEWLTREGA